MSATSGSIDAGQATTLSARDGARVPLHRWPLQGATPRARILCVHGRGEHGGRYAEVAQALAPHGLECGAIDLPGFGRTVGGAVAPGRLRRFEEYYAPIEAGLLALAALDLTTPTFLLGHSVGGLAAVRWLEEAGADAASKTRLKGLILSSPFLAMTTPLGLAKRAIVGLISLLSPDKALPSSGTPNTRDGARWKAYVNDPLTVKNATARWLTETLVHQPLSVEQAKRVPVPVLVLQGGADPSSDPAVSRRFAEACGGVYKEYAGFLHEVLNEPAEDRAKVEADLVAWVGAQLAT